MKSTTRLIVLASVIGLFVWFFADALFQSGMFCFRDAGHFYYPLFRFCAQQWAAGSVPLWNPYENLGQPLAGNAAASVFYPGKLIFALPLSYAWAYKTYIMAHLLLAAGTAYRLARGFNASVTAAGVCAISYAFSGNVLFQYCNVVFLVGAAWLPLALLAADRMLLLRSARWAVALGVVLALMTLGGDPQMAYNAGLLAAIYALCLWRHVGWALPTKSRKGCPKRTANAKSAKPRWFTLPLSVRCAHATLLALAAASGLVLSAVQVLPSLEFTMLSGRRAEQSVADAWLARVEPGTHQEHVYHFSVGPWRLAEYVWPNVGGRQFPIHRRHLEVIPAEGRIWTPSLYMGLLPLLLALGALRLRRRCQARAARVDGPAPRHADPAESVPRDRWLSWTVILAVVAAFGWYGLGWVIQEIRLAAGADVSKAWLVGEPFGGLYWLMTKVLPGYGWFRYPAKLLVVAALGLSVLAARGWDRAFDGKSDRLRRVLLWLGGASVCGAIVSAVVRPLLGAWLSGVAPDVLFGPLDTKGAADDLLLAFSQTAVLCGAWWWLLLRARKLRWVPAAALVLVAVDLAVANRWLVVCAPQGLWQEQSKLAAAIDLHRTDTSSPCRVFRHPLWLPPRWKKSGSPDRLAEAVGWDRATLWPKYNLASRLALAEVYGTMMLEDYRRFLSAGRTKAPYSLAEYVILPGNKTLPAGRRIDVDVQDVSLWHNADHLPRAWIDGDPAGSCRVLRHDPLRVEIEARLTRPGTVVLCDQFYPGWELQVDTAGKGSRSMRIERVHQVMRGARLPPGEHRLVYRYRPGPFLWGALITFLGWLALCTAATAVTALRRRKAARPGAPC